jgi:pSer/pThr/pTyr-binding forkhead associated (FHA) protein
VKFNGRQIEIIQKNHTVLVDGEYVSSDRTLSDGMKIQLPQFAPIVADVLAGVEIDTRNLRDYKIKLNGREASFVDPVTEGDEVEFIASSKVLDETKGASEAFGE